MGKVRHTQTDITLAASKTVFQGTEDATCKTYNDGFNTN